MVERNDGFLIQLVPCLDMKEDLQLMRQSMLTSTPTLLFLRAQGQNTHFTAIICEMGMRFLFRDYLRGDRSSIRGLES